jgi:hypothetical protein
MRSEKLSGPALRPVVHLIIGFSLVSALSGCGRSAPPTDGPVTPPMEKGFDIFTIAWTNHQIPPKMKRGETVLVPVAVKNVGKEPIPAKFLGVCYHWVDAADPKKYVVYDGVRTQVTKDMAPGDTFETNAKVKAPDQQGRYVLVVDMVRDWFAWFGDRGAPTVRAEVQVE